MTIIVGFLVGILSSLAATWIVFLRGKARLRLRFGNVVSVIVKVARQLELDNFSPQYIVTVDRNSGVVGSILAGYIGLRAVVSVACEHRRLPDGSRETRLDDVSSQTLPLLRGSRLLVLICCNDSGTSLNCVVDYLRALGKDAPAEIRTAAIYTSVSPIIVPTYKGVIVGRDIRKPMSQIISKLPWMTKEWRHVLAKERLAPDN
jgi:hypoxanthine phosphoribosyltransferase